MLNIMHSGHSGSGYVTCKGDTEYHFLILVLREQPVSAADLRVRIGAFIQPAPSLQSWRVAHIHSL